VSVPTLTRGPHPDSQCVRGEPRVPEHLWPMDMLPIPRAVGVNLAPVDTKRSLRLSVLRLAGRWRFLVARRQRGQRPPLPVARRGRGGRGGRPLQATRLLMALTRKRKRLVCTLSNPVLGLVAAPSESIGSCGLRSLTSSRGSVQLRSRQGDVFPCSKRNRRNPRLWTQMPLLWNQQLQWTQIRFSELPPRTPALLRLPARACVRFSHFCRCLTVLESHRAVSRLPTVECRPDELW